MWWMTWQVPVHDIVDDVASVVDSVPTCTTRLHWGLLSTRSSMVSIGVHIAGVRPQLQGHVLVN